MKYHSRRHFVQKFGKVLGTAATGAVLTPLFNHEDAVATRLATYPAEVDVTENEDFWAWVQQSYSVSPNVINLNNGGVSPQPIHVQDAVDRYTRLSNEAPSYYMWRTLNEGRESLRIKLADLAGCSPEEVTINRNATEALETAIYGLNLKKDDQVVLSKQDYPNIINAWKQRALRDGVKLKWVNLDLKVEDEEKLVQSYLSKVDRGTRVLHITQIINWSGQIIPCQKIARAARKINPDIEIIVDGAHAFAHLDFKIPELECDYFGTSLHKWLCAPFGTGMLYVKKEKTGGLWPLFGAPEPRGEDIRKFEALGTRSFPIEMATGHAINFHNAIGSARKQKRLHYLKNYWLEQVLEMPEVTTCTSLQPGFGCAIANFSVEGFTPHELARELFKRSRLHTVAIVQENISGVRVTPHVYTPLNDLDRLVATVKQLVHEQK